VISARGGVSSSSSSSQLNPAACMVGWGTTLLRTPDLVSRRLVVTPGSRTRFLLSRLDLFWVPYVRLSSGEPTITTVPDRSSTCGKVLVRSQLVANTS